MAKASKKYTKFRKEVAKLGNSKKYIKPYTDYPKRAIKYPNPLGESNGSKSK